MNKHVYICGDSFGVSDLEYGPNWVDILSQKFTVTNLCQVCAANLLISQQVDKAIAYSADFIICLGTSSTRQVINYQGKIVPYSLASIDDTTKFSLEDQNFFKKFRAEFFDLTISIYESKCIIENTLQKLVDSDIPFLFDQGGFEHAKFGGKPEKYFTKYRKYFSEINLWSYTDTRPYRPYYHISDSNVHKQVADYYINAINKT